MPQIPGLTAAAGSEHEPLGDCLSRSRPILDQVVARLHVDTEVLCTDLVDGLQNQFIKRR
jgi:hypothetical protein